MDFQTIPSDDVISKTVEALKANGIEAIVVDTGEQAKQKVLEMIPQGSPVMTMTSQTGESIGLYKELNESGKYIPSRAKLSDPNVPPLEKKMLGGATEWTVGSAHAVTQDGKIMIASNTGSQLGAYAYGAMHLIWVIGAQKIVKDLDEGFKRIYDYVLPLESVRANKAYKITTGSNVRKMLIVNSEGTPDRIKMVIIKEQLGF